MVSDAPRQKVPAPRFSRQRGLLELHPIGPQPASWLHSEGLAGAGLAPALGPARLTTPLRLAANRRSRLHTRRQHRCGGQQKRLEAPGNLQWRQLWCLSWRCCQRIPQQGLLAQLGPLWLLQAGRYP